MKTNQLILAAALVALAACSKENIDTRVSRFSQREIGFNAVATKANDAIISGTVYDTDNTFQVWGWQSESGAFTEFSDGAASNFMSDLTISWCGGPKSRENAWRNNANYYYWPFSGAIGFLAVHPSTVAVSSNGWDAANVKAKATVDDYTISDANKTTDLMFAYNAGSRRTDALPMAFKHALSQIVVNVKTDDDYTDDVAFDVDSVVFNNIDLSGDLAYANEAFTWSDNAAQTESWKYYGTTLEDITKTAQVYGAAIVMIPQPENAYVADPLNEGTTLTVGYSMEQTNSAKISGKVTVRAPQAWEAGKRYVYTLNFKLNEILFNPSVTDWVDVNVNTINILD